MWHHKDRYFPVSQSFKLLLTISLLEIKVKMYKSTDNLISYIIQHFSKFFQYLSINLLKFKTILKKNVWTKISPQSPLPQKILFDKIFNVINSQIKLQKRYIYLHMVISKHCIEGFLEEVLHTIFMKYSSQKGHSFLIKIVR